jgi:hypothetical protein
MSTESSYDVPDLPQWLRLMRTCSGDYLCDLASVLELHRCLPGIFLATLDDNDLTLCYRVAIIRYGVTVSIQVPQEMQLKAVLSGYHGKDTLVSAGTGSGKTLPIALNVLLNDPDKQLITLTLSPLKCLQVTQESDFNACYGIPTVVINEDTPREDAWWNVTITRLVYRALFQSDGSVKEHVWNYKQCTPGQARLLIVTVE